MYAIANEKFEVDKDRKIAIISSTTFIVLLLITAYFTTFFVIPKMAIDIPPYNSDDVIEEMLIDNVEMARNDDAAGGSGSGISSNDPVGPPSAQTEKILTSSNSNVQVNSGNSHNHNSNNSTNTSSTTQHSENPFGTGGSGTTGQGAGNSPFGNDVGNGGNGTGPGAGTGGRVRLNDPNTSGIIPDQDATINLKVTINDQGAILSVSNIPSKTTTTDQTIINKVIAAVKRDVKYSKSPGTTNATQYITVKLYAQ
ncbi:MAG: hypothetical protein V4638_10875 [Bacteroidota bacterium]